MMFVLWRQGQSFFISRLIRNDDGIGSGWIILEDTIHVTWKDITQRLLPDKDISGTLIFHSPWDDERCRQAIKDNVVDITKDLS